MCEKKEKNAARISECEVKCFEKCKSKAAGWMTRNKVKSLDRRKQKLSNNVSHHFPDGIGWKFYIDEHEVRQNRCEIEWSQDGIKWRWWKENLGRKENQHQG